MRASLNRHRIEVLLALVVVVVAYYAAQGLLAMQDAHADYDDALEQQQDVQAEAAQYDLVALTSQRDRLEAAPVPSAFPSRDEVESHIATIAALLDQPAIELGPIVIGEITEEVTDADIAGARTYEGIEMSLSINGDVLDLLDLAEQVLAAVPDATFRDVTLMLAEAPGGQASLSFSVLLYYDEP